MANHCIFSFFFFFFISFLVSPLVSRSSRLVKYLPGFHGVLPFELETGYVGVGDSEEVQYFYYFIKSERNPSKDPLMVWFAGGPGCSALCAWAFEIGPLEFKIEEYNGSTPTLLRYPGTWTKAASIIFLDMPAGSGFSYSKTSKGCFGSDKRSAQQVDQFVRKWLLRHPEFLSNPFYVTGDSYSGKVVPPVTLHISDGNDQGVKPHVNLKGYLIVNPLTDEAMDLNSRVPYAHRMALISDELYESLVRNCKGEYQTVSPGNTGCSDALQWFAKCVEDIFPHLITGDKCDYEAKNPRFKCKTYYYTLGSYWANDKTVREVLGIRKGSIGEWIRCKADIIPYDYDIPSSFPYHAALSAKEFGNDEHSGDHDMKIPHVGTEAWIRGLNYTIVDQWRPWMHDGQVQGYAKTYANRMTFATVKGGGHTPEFKRYPYYIMFRRWIDGEPL